MDAFQRVKGMKMPPAGPAAGIAKVLLAGGAAAYAFNNALFNVEGGHRAVVFNRLVGIKDTVRETRPWSGEANPPSLRKEGRDEEEGRGSATPSQGKGEPKDADLDDGFACRSTRKERTS